MIRELLLQKISEGFDEEESRKEIDRQNEARLEPIRSVVETIQSELKPSDRVSIKELTGAIVKIELGEGQGGLPARFDYRWDGISSVYEVREWDRDQNDYTVRVYKTVDEVIHQLVDQVGRAIGRARSIAR